MQSNLARSPVSDESKAHELKLDPRTLRAFYVHVLQNPRLVEANSEASYACTTEGLLAVAFQIDLDAEGAPPTRAELVLSPLHEKSLKHIRGVEVYRVHILDIGIFADNKTREALRLVISGALKHQRGLVTHCLVEALKRTLWS